MTNTVMSYENAAEMGLSAEEFDRVCAHMGRIPNLTELGVFSAMMNGHQRIWRPSSQILGRAPHPH